MSESEPFSDDAQDLLQYARKARPRTNAERTRTSARIVPIAIGLSTATWWSSKAFAAALAMGTVVTVATAVWIQHRDTTVSHPPGHHSAISHRELAPRDAPIVAPAVNPAAVLQPIATTSEPPIVRPALVRPMHSPPVHEPVTLRSAIVPESTETVVIGQPTEVAVPHVREDQCLSEAQRILESDPAGALVRVASCEQMFPHGAMVAERELLAIEALRGLGRTDQARTRAESFIAQFPHSIYSQRVTHLIESLH